MNEQGADQGSNSGVDGLQANPALVFALKRLLRPLVHLLLAKGIGFPYVSNLLKTLYVNVAADDFALAGKRQTDSRLSLLSGVHRKDVRRLMNEPRELETAPANVSFGARLVARWCGEKEFTDASGNPKPLPRLATADGGPSFERLVAQESKDIRSRAVLDEWLRLGLVEIDAEGRVTMRSGAFVPQKGEDEKLYFLGRNVHDHLAAASQNVMNEQAPFLERSVYSDGLNEAAIAELAALSEKLGMEALRTINRRARQLRETSAGATSTHRMSFGIYYFHEPTAAPDETKES